MANEIGTSLLSGLTNSSFKLGEMSKTLAEAEVDGKRSFIERKQEQTTTELDAIKYLKTNLDAFKSYVSTLSSPDLFEKTAAESSDDSIVSVTTSSDVAPASYQIESKQMAQTHTLVSSDAYNSPSDSLGTGTFSYSVGGKDYSLNLDSSNNTLEGLQKVINNGDYGMTASIVNNGGNYQMMFTSEKSGASGEIAVDAASDFFSTNMVTTTQAQDAVMSLNGLTLTNDSNTFDNAIDGVTFNLKSASPGTPVQVGVSNDTSAVSEEISKFVDVYNQLHTITDELGSYDKDDLTQAELESEEYQYYGDLAGSRLLRGVESQIRSALSGAIEEIEGNFNSLSVVGISFDREGKLSFDESKLNAALSSDVGQVKNLFAEGGHASDTLINVISGSEKTKTGNYDITVSQLAERATLTGSATTKLVDERVGGDRILDSEASLTLAGDAQMSVSVGGSAPMLVDFSSISGQYADKNALSTAMQQHVNDTLAAGGVTETVSFNYDASQARFEMSSDAGSGSLAVSGASGLGAQGFNGDRTGSQLIDLTASPMTFDVQVDDSEVATVSVQAGRYTMDELADAMSQSVNENTEIASAGAGVSVTHDGSKFSVASQKFGANSSVTFSQFSGGANAGLALGAFTDSTGALADQDLGQNVDGFIKTESGYYNFGASASSEDGRRIEISDFAFINSEPAEIRGLTFEVLGGNAQPHDVPNGNYGADRGSLTFSQGFASRLDETIDRLLEEDTGLVQSRVETLTSKNERYAEENEKLDRRYEMLLQKYQMEFSAMQSILSSTEETRNMLTQRFGGDN